MYEETVKIFSQRSHLKVCFITKLPNFVTLQILKTKHQSWANCQLFTSLFAQVKNHVRLVKLMVLYITVQRNTPTPRIIVIYLFIHGKCNHWDYGTITRDIRIFKLWRACSPHHRSVEAKHKLARHKVTLARHKLSATAKI